MLAHDITASYQTNYIVFIRDEISTAYQKLVSVKESIILTDFQRYCHYMIYCLLSKPKGLLSSYYLHSHLMVAVFLDT